jgi:putative adenylate-forming enzyme
MGLMQLFRVARKCRSLERSCQWTRDRLERHQSQSLDALRRFAFERSPFYRRFHKGLEDRPLEALPVLTKSILMEDFDQLVTDPDVRLADVEKFMAGDPGFALFRGRYVVLLTSGTTGMRGVFLFDPREWVTMLANAARPIDWTRSGRRMQTAERSAVIASSNPWHYSARVADSLSTRSLLRLDAGQPLDRIVQRLNQWQPRSLVGYPSVLRQLAQEQIAGRLRLSVERVATSAEVLTGEARQRIHEAWGVNVYDNYNATEYAPIAAECAEGRKHLLEDGAIVEIVDERGRVVPPGVCGDRVLLTVFSRRTQPLIRYEITDMVRPLSGECPCGRKYRLIEDVEGRLRDILTFPRRDGGKAMVTAHANLFYPVLESARATAWQLIHDERGLWVSFTGLRNPDAVDQISSSIRTLLERQGAVVPPVHVREVAVLERGTTGKVPLILSRIPQ